MAPLIMLLLAVFPTLGYPKFIPNKANDFP